MSQAAGIPLRNARSGQPRSGSLRQFGTVVGGGALAVFGLTRQSTAGYLLAAGGGALAYYGIRSHPQHEFHARSTIQLNCSTEEAYRFWHDFENLPRFMRHLESVSNLGEGRSRWVAIGPLGKPIHWDAQITQDIPYQLIAWQSLPESDLEVNGRVEFRSATANRGTILDASILYRPPAGQLGRSVAKLLGKDPTFMIHNDLRRFKALVETGEIPTTEGQSHGSRDLRTGIARVIDPDNPIRRNARLTEAVAAQRRIS